MTKTNSSQTDHHENKFSLLQIRVVFIALLLMVLDGFDILSMAFLAQRIGEQLHINNTHLGMIFSITLAGMMIGATFIAPYADKYGRRIMLVTSVFSISISMYLTGFSENIWHLLILRGITGLGVGAMLANITALTSEFAPPKYASLCIAIVTAGFPLGATMAGMMIAPILPTYGWENIFFALGFATLIMAIIVYLYIPESVQYLKTLNTDDALQKVNVLLVKMKQKTLDKLEPPTTTVKTGSVKSILNADFLSTTIQLWLTFFFVFVSMYFLMSWLPKLTIIAGFSEADGIYSAVAFNGGGVIGTIILGWLARQMPLNKLIGMFLVISSMLLLLFSYITPYINFFILLFFLGFFIQGGFVGLYSLSAKIYPTQVRATGIGWALGLGRFGAVVGPYVGGLLINQGMSLEMNFIFFAVPLGIASLLIFKLHTLDNPS